MSTKLWTVHSVVVAKNSHWIALQLANFYGIAFVHPVTPKDGIMAIKRSQAQKRILLNVQSRNAWLLVYPIPAFTTRIEHHDEVCEYLRSVNSYEAYENGLIRIRYAPREKRVLFYNQDNDGAVGRAMYHLGGKGPKWMTYGDISHGIAVGSGETAVIVEDAASACSIASLGNVVGFAILGTNITNTLKNTLRNYLYKYILLDNDAQKKAVSMQKMLRGNTFIRTTNKDPKELTKEQLLNTLRITTTNKPHQPST